MKVAIYYNEAMKNSGGSFAILMPTGELSHEETFAKDIPAGSQYKIVDLTVDADKAELDRVMTSGSANVNYWAAWVPNLDDADAPISFSIDMERAKQCHLFYLRKMRDDELPELDIAYQRADEVGNAELKAEIAAKKQKLRNMPSDTRIVNCTDFETLKTLTYETLRDS